MIRALLLACMLGLVVVSCSHAQQVCIDCGKVCVECTCIACRCKSVDHQDGPDLNNVPRTIKTVPAQFTSTEQDHWNNPPLPANQSIVHEGKIVDRFRENHPLPLGPDGKPEGRFKHLVRAPFEVAKDVFEAMIKGLIGTLELPYTFAQVISVLWLVAGGLCCVVPFMLIVVIIFIVWFLKHLREARNAPK